MAENLVAPAPDAAPPVAPTADPNAAPAPAPDASQDAQQGPQISPDLLKVPAIQGLLVGAPPAVSAQLKQLERSELGKDIESNKDALLAAGFGFYKSIHGGLAVMFNRFHIHGEDLKAADKAGKLQVLAPPFDQVDHALAKSKSGDILKAGKLAGGFASQAAPIPAQVGAQDAAGAPSSMEPSPMAPAAGGASAALAKRLQGARVANLQPGAPTSGPAPGGGRLLNSILKQVV